MAVDKITKNIMLSTGEYDQVKQYWERKLAGPLKMSSFPPVRPGTRGSKEETATVERQFDGAISQKILDIANQSLNGVFVFLAAGVLYLLQQYTQEEELLVGMPVLLKEGEPAPPDHFLALKTGIHQEYSLVELLQETKQAVLEANQNAALPWAIIAELLGWQGEDEDSAQSFKTVILLENIHGQAGPAPFPGSECSFRFRINSENVELTLDYNTGRYQPFFMNQICNHLETFFKTVVQNTRIQLAAVKLLSEEEERRLLSDFNQSKREFPASKTIPELFESQVEQTPENVAIEYEEPAALELWPSTAEYLIYDDLLYYAMIHDERRNQSYRAALNQLAKDKVVVEIGTGSDAILAKFCIQAGARRVYAIELLPESYRKAKDSIERAGLTDKIILIHGDATKVDLPEKADLCVSEIVGAIGGSEGAAVILNNARRFLKEEGVMVPLRSITKIAATTLPEAFTADPAFSELSSKYVTKIFDAVGYPFDLRVCLKNFSQDLLISNEAIFEALDFSSPTPCESKHEIKLRITRNDTLQGFIVWLNLYTAENELINILEHEYCWLPVFVPAFYPGINVSKGDCLWAMCERKLDVDSIHPDFRLQGYLEKHDGTKLEFQYDLPHIEKSYLNNSFYQKLFQNNQIRTYRDNVMQKRITYRELNHQANQMADLLKSQGVKPGKIVGLMMDRSPEAIVGMLGVLKAGGAYLPIDPQSMPENRALTMLKDSGADLLLTKDTITTKHQTSFAALQAYESRNPEIIKTAVRPQILDFDSLPFTDPTLVNYEKYFHYLGVRSVKNAVNIQASRGCPYHCLYCHKIWPKKNIVRSAERIFEEVKLYYDIGIRRFSFIDDIFNLDVVNSSQFFELIIKNKMKMQLHFPNGLRGDILTHDYIDLMIEAGTMGISLALETASPRIQKLLRKNLNLDKFHDNCDYLAQKYPQVLLTLFTMHGFPTETEAEAMQTLDFIKSIHWFDYVLINILKIFPDTEIEALALANGIKKADIERSFNRAYYELPDTLPFPKEFTMKYRTEYFDAYFCNRERFLAKLPWEMQVFTEEEFMDSYRGYLSPEVEINRASDVFSFAGVTREELGVRDFVPADYGVVPDFNNKVKRFFPAKSFAPDAFKILLLDLSQTLDDAEDKMFTHIEPPIGLMYLLSHLNQEFGEKIHGKIAKPVVDFDDYQGLQRLIAEFEPDMIGIRTLSYYKEFFHKTIALIRQWGYKKPIISGGPYATSSYQSILKDENIDLVVLGEGEMTLKELVEKMIGNGKKMPPEETLKEIAGIAYAQKTALSSQFGRQRKIIMMDYLDQVLAARSGSNLPTAATPDDLAYIIYTSGSTGQPKGVMLRHQGMSNLAIAQIEAFRIKPPSRVLQFASFSFDASVSEIYTALLSGSTLCLMNREKLFGAADYYQLLRERKINVATLPPSLLKNMDAGALPDLKVLISAGESCTPEIISFWAPGRDFYNAYGPTENTVCASIAPYGQDGNFEQVTIGFPMANVRLYILDRELKLVPVGAPGELYIGGVGLAEGYLNRPELTQERFIANPFIGKLDIVETAPPKEGIHETYLRERLYKTGDLARWLPDGSIDFIGRSDYQVKVRGYRIELGEIEARLIQHEAAQEAVVIAREDGSGAKDLVAYFVAAQKLGTSELRNFLAATLPEYMIPAYFIQLEKFPLTPSGKINRKALPAPDENFSTGTAYAAPETANQIKLVDAWKDVLGVKQIGVHDNFFELGGDSIKAMQVASRLNEQGLKLEVKDLQQHPTISELSHYIHENRQEISQAAVEGEVVLTPIQRWFFASYGQEYRDHFNQAVMLYRKEGFDENVLHRVFTAIINHHDALRMVYRSTGASSELGVPSSRSGVTNDEVAAGSLEVKFPAQYNRGVSSGSEDGLFGFKVVDLIGEAAWQEQIAAEAEAIQKSIDINAGPLVKLGLFKTGAGDHLLIVIHHLVVDAVSWQIIIQDLTTGYEQLSQNQPLKFPAKTTSYLEWAQRLQKFADSNEQLKELIYWKEIEAAAINPLPKDHMTAADQVKDSRTLSFGLPERETEQLMKQAHQAYNTDVNDLLLAALGFTLQEWTGDSRFIINLEGHGREEVIVEVDITRTVGWFTSIFPVILDLSRPGGLGGQIKTIKENLRHIPNRGFGYGILKYLTAPANLETLRFQQRPEICYNYFGQFSGPVNPTLAISSESSGADFSPEIHRPYTFNITATIHENKLGLSLNYNRRQYEEETILNLLSNYQRNIMRLLEHCLGKESIELTPSDLGTRKMDLDQFENLVREIADLDED